MIYKCYLILYFFSFILSNINAQSNGFSYNTLDRLYRANVDENGRVDYNEIIKNPYDINTFINFIKNISPESHPNLFKTENDKIAFWINAYNAIIIKIMIQNPNKNILDINLFGHSIFLKKFLIGNKEISPYEIENSILRKRYQDPRIHFAINCASISCPPLGKRIYKGVTLNEQLDQKTNFFLNDKNNVYFDTENKILHLNKIFKWYKKDFLIKHNTIIEYILEYIDRKDKDLIYSEVSLYKIKYYNYDWSINSQ